MADDYIAMIERIEDEVDDANIRDQIKLAIQDSIKHYQRREFYFNQSSFTFATVAGQANYGTAANASIPNLLLIKSMYVTSSGIRFPMFPVAYDALDNMQDGLITSSPPTNWAYYGQELWLYPIPNAVETVTVSAILRLAALSADADTNAWMVDGEELIRQHAKWIIASDITHEPEEAATAQAREAIALKAIERDTAQRRGRPAMTVDAAMLTSRPFNIYTGQ